MGLARPPQFALDPGGLLLQARPYDPGAQHVWEMSVWLAPFEEDICIRVESDWDADVVKLDGQVTDFILVGLVNKADLEAMLDDGTDAEASPRFS